jgi:hypothetical protein
MTKLLIGVRNAEPDDGRLWVYVEDGSVLPNAGALCAIDFDPLTQKLDTLENVALYGKTLCAELEKHEAIRMEFAQLFNAADDRNALEFLVIAGEDVRWESLCDDNTRFLALNDGYRLARVTTRTPPPNAQSARQVRFPLKMLAYLSPAGVSSADEYRNICTRIVEARESGLAIEAMIYVSDQDILDRPEDHSGVTDGRFQGVTVAPLPSASEIEKQLKSSYQFLHFFSLATIADQECGRESGSVLLPLDTLTAAMRLNQSVWLAVFNSCSGAAGTRAFNSLAWSVAKQGCPYAVGMAEPIEPRVAAKFSAAFYEALFATTRDAIKKPRAEEEALALDFSDVVNPARKAIRDHCQSDRQGAYGRWLTPVIYMSTPNPLVVFLPSADEIEMTQGNDLVDISVMAERTNMIASFLRVLPRETPDDVRNGIFALLDKPPVVPLALRPDRYGRFRMNGGR